VLAGGSAGVLVDVGDPRALATALAGVLGDPRRRAELAASGARAVAPYDWGVITHEVLRVYELAIAGYATA
jgi:phosphatidylinositol alpha-mannosyltransferase